MTDIPIISIHPGGMTPKKEKPDSLILENTQFSRSLPLGSKLKTIPDKEIPVSNREIPIPKEAPASNKGVPPVENENKKIKDDYIAKINYLRRAFPNANVPEPEADQSAEELVKMFNRYCKRIRVESAVEQNKSILFIIWVVIELGFCGALRLPFSGYTKDQFRYLDKYQSLLIELSESSISEDVVEEWHPIIRILATTLLNAVIYLFVNFLINRIGNKNEQYGRDLQDMMINYLTGKGKNKESLLLKRAEGVTAENQSTPIIDGEAKKPFGNLGDIAASLLSGATSNTSMLQNLASMFMGGMGGGANNVKTPEVKRPRKFARANKDKKDI